MNYSKYIILFTLAFSISGNVFSQSSRILSRSETDKFKNKIGGISMPVFRAYENTDQEGIHTILFCENNQRISGIDTSSSALEAVCFLTHPDEYVQKWKIYDTISATKDIQGDSDSSIWFWSKYITNLDIDKDGRIEPVIVYGTKTVGEYSKIKIIIFYKDIKYSIKAQESQFDEGRTFKKSANYPKLPASVKIFIDNLIERLRTEQDLILKNG